MPANGDWRGSQYASEDYRAVLQKHGLTGSMGRRGNPYDLLRRPLAPLPVTRNCSVTQSAPNGRKR